MKSLLNVLGLICALTLATASAYADGKHVLIDRTLPQAVAAVPHGDAMTVSVLLESPDGTLEPHGAGYEFHTGERFRVRIVSARDATVSLYNTNPSGELSPQPIWSGRLKAGLGRITPRLRLEGAAGVDLLHVVLAPPEVSSALAWLQHWLLSMADGNDKDIVLDREDTAAATYLERRDGLGIVATIRITHQ